MTSIADQVGTAEGAGDDTPVSITHDLAFDLLSNPRRRFVLNRLQTSPEGVEIGDLATELASYETDAPEEDLSRKERKRIYVSLYQTHVPKLEEAGVVTYDSESGIVEPTDRLATLTSYFDGTDETPSGGILVGVPAVVGFGLYTLLVAMAYPPVDSVKIGIGLILALGILGFGHFLTGALRDDDGPSIPVDTE